VKVILVIPPQYEGMLKKDEWFPQMGIASIASVLESKGMEVNVIDAIINNYTIKETLNGILCRDPDAIGITATTLNRFSAIELCNAIKKQKKKCLTFVGGVHFTPTAKNALEVAKGIDVVVRGEGEETVLEMLNCYFNKNDFKNVLGITYRNEEGKVIENKNRPLIKDLNSLPLPAYHLFPLSKYQSFIAGSNERERVIGAASTRGCPYNCIFCACGSFWQGSFRRKDPKIFVDEVQYLYNKYGIKAFRFVDDTFILIKSHVTEICKEILKRRLKIRWFASARVNGVDKEILLLMKKAGCISIGYGIESGSQRVLDTIGKQITLSQIRNAVKLSMDLGFFVKTYFMASFPGETLEDFKQTLNLIEEFKKYGGNMVVPSIGITQIYPGTEIERIAHEESLVPRNFSWNTYQEFPKSKLFTISSTVPIYENSTLLIEKIHFTMSRFSKGNIFENAVRFIIWISSVRSFNDLNKKIKLILAVIRLGFKSAGAL